MHDTSDLIDPEVLAYLSDVFQKTGGPPEESIRQVSIRVQEQRALARLKPPQRRIVIRGFANYFSGYGHLGLLTARALQAQGIECVYRPFDSPDPWVTENIELVSDTQDENWELLIAPPIQRTTIDKATVFLTMWEAGRLSQEQVAILNEADAVIVPCDWNMVTFNASGVTVPLYKLPLAIDPGIYYQKEGLPSVVTFGACGLNHPRKGFETVLQAFLKAFPDRKDVRLKFKIWEQPYLTVPEDPRIEVIAEFLSFERMCNWYNSLTCFVSGSPGEGFGLPPVEAMACGRPVLAVFGHAHQDYLNERNAYRVKHHFGMSRPNARENPYHGGLWFFPDVDDMAAQMRRIYNDFHRTPEKVLEKASNAEKTARRYSLNYYAKDLVALLKETGMYDPVAPVMKTEKKQLEVSVKVEGPEVTGLCVVGPQDLACGVGQYGRQVAEAIGAQYVPYLFTKQLPESVILQYHPFYWHNTDIRDYMKFVCETRKVIMDVHHPDRLNELPKVDHVIYHCKQFEVALNSAPRTYVPLMSPVKDEKDRGMCVAQSNADKVIGWHGLWQQHKGVHCLIEAVGILRREHLNVGMIAIGGIHDTDPTTRESSFAYWNHCMNISRNWGLYDYVGMSSRLLRYEDIWLTLKNVDAFCLPYTVDEQGQSSAAALGLALHKPMIVSTSSMFKDIASHAVVLSDTAPMVIARALKDLLYDDARMEYYRKRCVLGHALSCPETVGAVYRSLV